MKVQIIMRKLSEESMSRVQITKKVKYTWRDMLNKLEGSDSFKLDYKIPPEILFKKVMKIMDAKCPTKSNVLI
jgi:hypothetical protein